MVTNQLIQALQNSKLYDHSITRFKVLETHISWVILTGPFAYKIKKPVDFEVLNFSTLDKRHYYCQEEVRLNKLLAPELYVDVITITGSENQPQLNSAGTPIEYAIKMREFPQDEIFTQVLARNELTPALIDKLAKVIAEFHLTTAVAAADSAYGTPEHAHFPVIQNFSQVLPWLNDAAEKAQIAQLQNWAEQQFQQHQALFVKRKQQGFIRDCHGDLHLGNIILHNDKPLLFDRIEFNPDLRWNDVMADFAFLVMDLYDNQQWTLAHRLINTYFAYTGDYAGLTLLPYYVSYRAMVRAKVVLFHSTQTGLDTIAQENLKQQYRKFVNLAEHCTRLPPPALLITHGLSGSGKSTIARFVVEQLGAVQINSDAERKRLFNLPLTAQTNAELNKGIYSPAATEKTYAHLLKLANTIIQAGYTVVVDATFLKKEHRLAFANLAINLQIPFAILHCQAERGIVENWLTQRASNEHEASEAGLAVLNMQEQVVEDLDDKEKASTIKINANNINEQLLRKQLNELHLTAKVV
jgi:hypothetical protein